MADESAQQIAAGRVPQDHAGVGGRGQYLTVIGAESHVEHRVAVACQPPDDLAGRHIQHRDDTVRARRGRQRAIGVERNGVDRAVMHVQTRQRRVAGCVPQDQIAGLAAGEDNVAQRTPRQRADGGVVAGPTGCFSHGRQIPDDQLTGGTVSRRAGLRAAAADGTLAVGAEGASRHRAVVAGQHRARAHLAGDAGQLAHRVGRRVVDINRRQRERQRPIDLARFIGFDGLLRQHQAAVDTRFALSGRAGIEGKEGQQHGDQRDARQDQRAAAQAAR